MDNLAALIDKTEGASAAFIRELLRKAALFAAQHGDGAIRVTDRHIEEALREFTPSGKLNQTIRGASGFSQPKLTTHPLPTRLDVRQSLD